MYKSTSNLSCRIRGCVQNHNNHNCSLCKCSNSDHLSRNCPEAMHLYHGTTLSNFIQMCNDQYKNYVHIQPSLSGQMGSGIYFTTLVEAIKIADFRAQGLDGAVVIKVAVNLGKLKKYSDMERVSHCNISEWSFLNFDSATSIHQSWAGIDYPFRDWVVKNSNNLRVTDVWLMSGRLKQNLTVPNANVYLMPKFQQNYQIIKAQSVVNLSRSEELFSVVNHLNVSSLGGVIRQCQNPQVKLIRVQDLDIYDGENISEKGWVEMRFTGYLYEGSKIFHKEGNLHIYNYRDKLETSYQGEFKDGLYHGKGTLKFNDLEYEGLFEDGVYIGRMNYVVQSPRLDKKVYRTIFYPNGDRYEGEQENNLPHGYGIFHYSNGSVFVGLFNEGIRLSYGNYFTKENQNPMITETLKQHKLAIEPQTFNHFYNKTQNGAYSPRYNDRQANIYPSRYQSKGQETSYYNRYRSEFAKTQYKFEELMLSSCRKY
eukprot:403376496